MKTKKEHRRSSQPPIPPPKREWSAYVVEEHYLAINVRRFLEQWNVSADQVVSGIVRLPFVLNRFGDDIDARYRFAHQAVENAINRKEPTFAHIDAIALYFSVCPDVLLTTQLSFAAIERCRQKKFGGRFMLKLVRGPFEGRTSAWWTRPVEGRRYSVWTNNPSGFSRHVYRCLDGRLVYQGGEHGYNVPRRATLRVLGHEHGTAVQS